jgi:hypothetical protein
MKLLLDRRAGYYSLGQRLFAEISIFYPGLVSCAITPIQAHGDSGKVQQSLLVLLSFNRTIANLQRVQLQNWLETRTADTSVQLIIKP